jgi:hypothetical protein
MPSRCATPPTVFCSKFIFSHHLSIRGSDAGDAGEQSNLLQSHVEAIIGSDILFIMAGIAKKRQNREEFHAQRSQNGVAKMPQKKFYRQRAHANPFSDHTLI